MLSSRLTLESEYSSEIGVEFEQIGHRRNSTYGCHHNAVTISGVAKRREDGNRRCLTIWFGNPFIVSGWYTTRSCQLLCLSCRKHVLYI